VFLWETDGKKLFAKTNFTQFVSRNVRILGGRFYSPSLKDVAWLEDAQLIFSNFPFICLYIWLGRRGGAKKKRQMYRKLEKLTKRVLAKLHPSNLVKTIFYLVF